VFFERGEGAELVDVDGKRYVDYVQSWGALLFGHARREILEAAVAAAERGASFGAPTELEVRLAETIVAGVQSVEKVRLVSSGTEAAMGAIRLARGVTDRAKIVKFAGCYHGHADALLANAGSGVATFALPGTPGIPEAATADTMVLPYNDLERVKAAFAEVGEEVACVIVEPVAANMGLVPPEPGFLEGLRELTEANGALLVFDEVITGFRVARGGAQEFFGVLPDLTVLGKVMGGGFPCAALGGRAQFMDDLAPEGPVYQAGTLSGNPVACAAGLATLELIEKEDPYAALAEKASALVEGLGEILTEAGIPHTVNGVETILSVFFGDAPIRDYEGAKAADHDRYARFFHAMLEQGIYLPPSGYEAWFPGAAHTARDVELTIEAVRGAISES
jgi:glutamate-1-semialdehyde 2,1-aminomutase